MSVDPIIQPRSRPPDAGPRGPYAIEQVNAAIALGYGTSRRRASQPRAAAFLRLARPRQWPKNVLVFAAPAAAGALLDPVVMLRASLAALAFCVASSATYFLNDSLDAPSDRRHARKCLRPIAAGVITPREGLLASAAMFLLAIGVPVMAGAPLLAAVIATYALCQVAYSLRLKRLAIVEMLLVASGFVLRMIAGGVAVDIPLSRWFVVVTLFASLLIVVGKRLSEFVSLGPERASHRAVLERYSLRALLGIGAACAAVAVIAYIGWALHSAGSTGATALYYATIPPFVAGIGTYLLLAYRAAADAPEELLYGHRSMQLIAAAWATTFMLAVYVH